MHLRTDYYMKFVKYFMKETTYRKIRSPTSLWTLLQLNQNLEND